MNPLPQQANPACHVSLLSSVYTIHFIIYYTLHYILYYTIHYTILYITLYYTLCDVVSSHVYSLSFHTKMALQDVRDSVIFLISDMYTVPRRVPGHTEGAPQIPVE